MTFELITNFRLQNASDLIISVVKVGLSSQSSSSVHEIQKVIKVAYFFKFDQIFFMLYNFAPTLHTVNQTRQHIN